MSKKVIKGSVLRDVFPWSAVSFEALVLVTVWAAFAIPTESWVVGTIIVVQSVRMVILEWLMSLQKLYISEIEAD